jgi:hypothetical protein
MADFGDLIANSPEADGFLQAEVDKLKIQIKSLEVSQLKYLQYEFYLDFINISVDPVKLEATVLVTEGYDVVFESLAPTISSMRNLEHTIKLEKEGGRWRITTDYYQDFTWRILRESGVAAEELLNAISDSPAPLQTVPLENLDVQASTYCNLSPDVSSYAYNREGAVGYARDHAYNYYEEKYGNYGGQILGGDCTNFVSQAIHEVGRT